VLYDGQDIARLLRRAAVNVLCSNRAIDPGDEPVKICLQVRVIVEFHQDAVARSRPHGSPFASSSCLFFFVRRHAAALAERSAAYVPAGRAGVEYKPVHPPELIPRRIPIASVMRPSAHLPTGSISSRFARRGRSARSRVGGMLDNREPRARDAEPPRSAAPGRGASSSAQMAGVSRGLAAWRPVSYNRSSG